MIKKFKNFDANEFISKKKALKESAEGAMESEKTLERPTFNEDDLDIKRDDVIYGTPVYEEPYLVKISNIVIKKLQNSGLGEFGVYYSVIYLDNIPGVWIYSLGEESINIICCRSTNVKSISVFKDFEPEGTNKAIVTYSTEKLGFTDMIEELISFLKSSDDNEVLEGKKLIGRSGGGWSAANAECFRKLDIKDKDFIYTMVSKEGPGIARKKMETDSTGQVEKIMKVFAPKSATVTAGGIKVLVALANDIINDAAEGKSHVKYADQDDNFAFLRSEYVKTFASGSGTPAMSVSYGEEYEISDAEAEEAARVARIKEAEEERVKKDYAKYRNALQGLKETTEAMCNYVKNNGELSVDDESILTRRAILLTGIGGIGKTHNITEVLKEKNMVENIDYVWITLDKTTSDSLYTILYEYNGKLIVFDDAPKLFEGDYRIALWKNALQTDIDQCKIGYPNGDSRLNVYNVKRLKGDRQRQYFVEIGHKSDEDRMAFYNAEFKRRGLKVENMGGRGNVSVAGVPGVGYLRNVGGETLSDKDIQAIANEVLDMWKEEQENAKPCMPNSFIFKGVVIIICNESRERFISEMGQGNWGAIQSRFENYDINPSAEAMWMYMKDIILEQYNDKTKDDRYILIPRDMTEEFIDEMERLISEIPGALLNWRTIVVSGKRLRGTPGRRVWKEKLEDELRGGTGN